MSILSFSYFFLVLILLVLYYIFPLKIRWIILLFGSVVFYFLSSGWLIVYLFLSTIIIYFLGLMLDKEKNQDNKEFTSLSEEDKKLLKEKSKKKQKKIILVGILLLILFIVVTKYVLFLVENINWFFNLLHIKNISISNVLIPLGISYYTLEAISYLVDIYRGKIRAEKNFGKVLLYLIYFPKIIEGPITRFKEFSDQSFNGACLKWNNIIVGMDYIIYGLFKKMVIADRAGIFVNHVFDGNFGGVTVFLAMILYTVQIYAEFSGCIDIVRGVSQLFGIVLPTNFKRPMFSKSVQEFWQRWHITLGSWIREYVFFPISLSKMNQKVCKYCKEKWSLYWYKFISVAFPLLFVWLVNGLWHGASYKYIVYGMYYYVIMMIGVLFNAMTSKFVKKLNINKKVLDMWGIFRTCFLVVVGMTLFRASSIQDFGNILISVFKTSNGVLGYGLEVIDFIILLGGCFIIFIVSILEEKNIVVLEDGFTNKPFKRGLVYALFLIIIILFGIYGSGYDASSFIYGAF